MSTSSPTANSPSLPAPDPQRTAEARAAFTTHLNAIGESHLSTLSRRAADIGINSTAISKQEEDLEKNAKKLGEGSKKQEKVVDDASRKLKELGDVQNWAEVLERDLLVVEEALDRAEEGSGWVTEEDEEAGEDDQQRGKNEDTDERAKGEDEGATTQGATVPS